MNAYRKGANGERELAAILSQMFGIEAKRGASPFLPGFLGPDVYGLPHVHVEVKRRSKLSLPAALRQARFDATGKVPVVCHRPNCERWMLTIWLEDLTSLVRALNDLSAAGTDSIEKNSEQSRAENHSAGPGAGMAAGEAASIRR
jgi:hypothetical protein